MGFYGETSLFECVGIGVGMYGNVLTFQIANGEASFGQELSQGISATFACHNFGYTEYMYNKNFRVGEREIGKGFYGDETYTIYSAAAYLGYGVSVRFGFDVVTFCKDLDSIFTS